jgi:GH15 family glucan-1,4-alpha-glucosidase
MAKPVVLGNSSLTVGINESGLVHDFYYPYVGLENLTNSRMTPHKIGIFIDGVFSWLDSPDWIHDVNFDDDALVSNISATNNILGIRLNFNDFVDSDFNAFLRIIKVENLSEVAKEIKLFMHQVFEISQDGRADTALFVPEDNYILDYKGRCCLLIYGQSRSGIVFDQFAIGSYGIEGKQGTFIDAEDGSLSNNPVEHGGVDSVIGFSTKIEANEYQIFDYWIVATDSQYRAEEIHFEILKSGLEDRLSKTKQFWNKWLSISATYTKEIDTEYLSLLKKSLMLIKVHTDKRGGIIASSDSSIYNYGRDYYSYVWPRDGAYAIWPLIRLGYTEEPKKFFEFCKDIITDGGYLMHKYQPDRAVGSTWHPLIHDNRKELAIQEDETAIVIYMIGEYFEHTKDRDFIEGMYDNFIKPAANFMCKFIDTQTNLPHASYDLWEEKFATHTYSVAVVYQALLVASDIANELEHTDDATYWEKTADTILENRNIFYDFQRGIFRKSIHAKNDGSLEFDNTLDISSLYGIIMFGYHDKDFDKIASTQKNIENILLDKSPSKGLPRYENDNYFLTKKEYLGNPWFVTTLWLAQYYHRANNTEKAKEYLKWTIDNSLPSGVLSEQVDPETGRHISVTPLVWSHAELINTIIDLS